MFAAALESKKIVWINAGSDADNDFSGRYNDDMMFSYSRKSGYGGSGSLPRGARVWNLTYNPKTGLHGTSYITEANGMQSQDMIKHSPPSFGFSR